MITIIDYKSGNLRSISNSFKKIGSKAIITGNPEEIANAKHLVLPGVGAFGTAMENIEPYKGLIYEHIDDGKPFLGICLGLQVLLSSSDEAPRVKGLDIFKGQVEKIPKGRKIPHMGWNQLKQVKNCPILDGLDGESFYFVHSYHAILDDDCNLSGTCDYGIDLTASISRDNVFATQFHPEKSGVPGLKILKNFVNL
ncbi:imidazole glycerol phosphate synthase subunit HisH [Methanobrevibacter olleyae]|uniref:Imidazole glycerol phosphate synthase subunit HisH n=1 Tax=Methanobrevibacter olleyae TaxID=294671 RepID=A0A126R1Z8_METOL|nr:imidazole glycerol phosphate synthase subunit HisH [Methanobrevibacter olleyae]AMK16054.1 imidazole glycerol phosphate synthase glutamine amidotransferase subunit HisH [Methanobrevibacter olleyae]SFL49835.1 glutamine amidotransferase [Methanobrevibacter olleyae]